MSVFSRFEGINQLQNGGEKNPPDVQIAAGPNHVVETVSREAEIFSKQGALMKYVNLTLLFGTGPDFVSDAKMLYDISSGRWFASIIALGPALELTHANVSLAVSMTTDPTGFWNVYEVNASGTLPDQPILGVSADKLVISANLSGGILGPYFGAQYWVYNKNDLISGEANARYAVFGPDVNLASVHPVLSLSSTTTQYMVTVGANVTSGSVSGFTCADCNPQLFAVTGLPPGNVTAQTFPLPVNPILAPPCGVEPTTPDTGCTNGDPDSVNTDDSRILDAVWYKGKLWFTLNDGCTPPGDQLRACARLVQVDTGSATVLQNFDFFAAGKSYYYPAISMDGSGNLIVIFGYSSSVIYPSLAVTGQGAGDPANSLATATTIRTGDSAEASDRYGDYFGASVDPSDSSLVWVAGEYHNSIIGTCQFGGTFPCFSTFVSSVRIAAFTLTASPGYLNASPGHSASSAVGATSLQNFVGTVSLSATVFPSASNGPTSSFTPSSLTLGANSSSASSLKMSTTHSTPAGTYTVNITGTSGARSMSVLVALRVGVDFTVTASPTTLSLAPGSTGTSTLSLTSINGLSGAISLIASVTPVGPTVNLSPTSLSLSSGGSGTVSLAVSTTSSLTPGTYVVSVNATGPGVFHVIPVVVNVLDFQIVSVLSNLTFIAGASSSSTITFASLGSFSGVVSLSVNSPTGVTATLSSSSLNLLSGFSNSTTLNVGASATGSYIVTVTGTSSLSRHSTTVSVTSTGNFTMTSDPSFADVNPGGTASLSIILTSTKNFTGTVTLSTSSHGATTTLNPSTLSLSQGGTATSTLTASASSLGSFAIIVSGTGGGVSHSINISFGVGGRACVADPSTDVDCSSANGFVFNGPLTNPATQLRVGVFVDESSAFNAYDVTLSADSTVLAPASVDFTGSSLGTGQVYCIGGQGPICTSQDTANTIHVVYSNYNSPTQTTALLFIAVYNITGTTTGTAIGFQTGCTNTSYPNACVTTYISGSFSPNVEIPQTSTFANGNQPYVTVTASPSFLGTVVAGTQESSTLAAVSNNGYPNPFFDTGIVSYGSAQQSALSVAISPSQVAPTPSIPANSTLTVTPSAAGFYTVTVYGTYTVFNSTTGFTSTLAATVILSVNVQDFRVTTSASSITILRGLSGTDNITLTSLNGFSGNASLTFTVSPVVANGPTGSINPQSILLSSGGTGVALLTISTSAQTPIRLYRVTVTGTSGGRTHSVSITVTVTADFVISANPSSTTLPLGSSGSSTITLTSLYSFSGNVTLTISSPSGVTSTLARTSLLLASGGTNSTVVTITANTMPGGTVTITGTSGSIIHFATVTVTVSDFTLSASPTSILVQSGAAGTSTLTVSPVASFTGVVGFTTIPLSGLTCNVSPSSLTLGPSQPSTLSCNGSAGNYTVTITAASGSLAHSVQLRYQVVDFTITGPLGINCVQGTRSCSYQLTVSSVNGFSGTVSLTVTARPAGTTVTLSASSAMLSPGGTATITVTVKPPASGIVTVQGASGSLTHSVTTHLTLVT